MKGEAYWSLRVAQFIARRPEKSHMSDQAGST